MAKKAIFISYDYDNDKHYKNMLLAWDANKEFDFGFTEMARFIAAASVLSIETSAE